MKKMSFWRGAALAALLLGTLQFALAADVNARIKGTVTDPSGSVLPGIKVTATNEATGVKFETQSGSDGGYLFPQLPIGTYTITVTANGFKGFSAKGIVLNIDQEYVEPVQLTVGSTAEVVEVQADAVQVNTTDMQLNNIVDAAQIVEYPLIGRSFVQLEQILPGVQASDDRFTNNFSVNGSQTQQSSYLIDGADTNDFALNTIGVQPNLDALGEFNLITGSQNAEYSRNSGAIVSATVKSGTNHIHGDAFEFYRDSFLNDANFFGYNSTKGKKNPVIFHQNLFGGTLGGPILRDKLFIFGAYQGNRARAPQSGQSGLTHVPSAAQRAGNFAASSLSKNVIPGTISIPGCVSGTDTFKACATKLGGAFPTSAYNPISAALLNKYVPLPNSGTFYSFNPITTTVQDQAIARVDFNPNSRDQIAFVGLYQHLPTIDTLPFTGATLPGFGDQNTSEIRQITGSFTHQFNANTLNQLAVHYTRFNFGSVTPQKVVQPSSLGFAISPQNAAGAGVPTMTVTGGFTLGFSTNGPQPRIDQTYQIDDNFSKVIGRHSLKIGYDGRRFNVDNEFAGRNNGSYSFSASGGVTNPYTSGSAYLDFFLGIPFTYSQGAGGRISALSYENYVYGQDTWKATNDLTIDFGLGYQIDTAIHNRQLGGKGVNCFVPNQQSKVFPTAPLSLNFPGDPGCNDAQGATVPYSDFGPRVGFAFAPDLGVLSGGSSRKLSIRGGYGIYYNRTEEEGSLQNLSQLPFGINSAGIRDSSTKSTVRPSFANPYQNINTGATITNPFPASFPKPGSTNVTFPANPFSVSQYARGYRAPYAENFELAIERELPGKIVATASYVGSVARHNQVTYEGNPITPAGHAACLADQTCIDNQLDQEVLYPSHTLYPQPINAATGATQWGSDGLIATEGSSNFNSLQLSMKKAPTHGLAAQISYTYGHALDDGSSFEGAGFGGQRGYNQYDKALNYGNSDYDARHRLVIAPIYSVPFRSGSPMSITNLLLGGWEVSGISTFATGHPFDISYQGGESYSLWCSADFFYYTCPDIQNQIAPLTRFNPHNTADKGHFFDGTVSDGTSATARASFADETTGQFGNISRNKYFGPGLDRTDMQLSKNFQYGDDASRIIQLRFEAYNVFNHTNFTNPNGNTDNGPATAGHITSAAAGRQIQLSGKIYF